MKRSQSKRTNTNGRTRGELLREELGETVDHAMRAAGHAAGGVGAAVRPRVAAARQAMAPAAGKVKEAFTPLTEAARAKVEQARGGRAKGSGRASSRRRWPVLAGLLAAGAAVGAVGAVVLRRRRAQEDVDEEHVIVGPVESNGSGPAQPATGEHPAELPEREPARERRE